MSVEQTLAKVPAWPGLGMRRPKTQPKTRELEATIARNEKQVRAICFAQGTIPSDLLGETERARDELVRRSVHTARLPLLDIAIGDREKRRVDLAQRAEAVPGREVEVGSLQHQNAFNTALALVYEEQCLEREIEELTKERDAIRAMVKKWA